MHLLRQITAFLLFVAVVLTGPKVLVRASGGNGFGSVRGGEGGGTSEAASDQHAGRHLDDHGDKKEGLFVPPPSEGNGNNAGGNKNNGNGNGNAFGHINQTDKFKPKDPKDKPVENRWIVLLSDDTDASEVDTKIRGKANKFRGRASTRFFRKLFKGGVIDNMSPEDAALLSEEPDVVLVEQDSETHATLAWGQDRIDQTALPFDGIYNPPNDGTGVTAYVLDTWVRTTHDEFEGRATLGLDLADDNSNPCGSSHGTHVAGTIGGKTYGVAPGVTIVSIVVLDCGGSGFWSWSAAGMDWAAQDCQARGGRCVANLSIGGGISDTANEAAEKLWNSGVFVAVAAGNENDDTENYSLGSANAVCVVASTTKTDTRSSFSNFGSRVDVFAPGSDILSAVTSSDVAVGTKSGTSMASPHLAGLAALHFNANPTQAPNQVLSAIKSDAQAVVSDRQGSPNLLAYASNSRLGCSPSCAQHGQCSSGSSNDCVCETGWDGSTCGDLISGVCGNSVCEAADGETSSSCPQDCAFELITTMGGGRSSAANMFDINVHGAGLIIIDQIDVHCDASGSSNIEIYYKAGSYSGHEADAGSWGAAISDSAVNCNGPGVFTPIVLPAPLSLTPGTHAFFVWSDNGLDYTYGISEGLPYSGGGNHPHLDTFEGIAMTGKFGGAVYSPRVWNGRMQYTVPTPCSNYSECDDGNSCTKDECVASVCQTSNLDGALCSAGICSGGECVECRNDGDCSNPTPFCNGNNICSACTLPTSNEWYIITNDGCNDGRSFGTNEDIEIIYYNAAIDIPSVNKIECEFKVLGDKDRKTKYKLDSADDLSMNDPSFPRCQSSDNTCRIKIPMGDIGRIGGWDGGYTANPNDPIVQGEWTSYKLKIQDGNGRYEFAVGTDLYATAPVANDAPCFTSSDPNYCDDSNPCTIDTCDQTLGCANDVIDCSGLDDTCNEHTCNPTTGACVAEARNDGVTCFNSNNNACFAGNTCLSGSCGGGSPVDCDDGNVCTDDSCDPASGCIYSNNQEPCDDENACTDGDACSGGTCVPGASVDCSHLDDACVTGTCDAISGCLAIPLPNGEPCDDGNACTDNDTCQSGTCVGGAAPDCDDDNICTSDSCDPASGCQNDPISSIPCDDGCSLTSNDECNNGVCAGTFTPGGCDDGNPCTDDAFDSSSCECTRTNNDSASCDDQNACTSGDKCSGGTCVPTTTVDCSQFATNCSESTCNPASGACESTPVADGTPCSDNDFCNGAETCSGGICNSPGDPCSASEMCDETNDQCVECLDNTDCDDGNPCTTDTCEQTSRCTNNPVDCSHLDNTCVAGTCDSISGNCVTTPSNEFGSCDDGNACTDNDTCQSGFCVSGSPKSCDDGNECTDDTCNPASGCEFSPNDSNQCSDGNACTDGDACSGGTCVPGASVDCSHLDGACVTGTCDAISGCLAIPLPNGEPCDDGNACTDNDTCQSGTCVGGAAPDCDDDNICTSDSCDPALGCINSNNDLPCNDQDACTLGDKCQSGSCQPGTPLVCADDGVFCNGVEECSGGTCVSSGDPCSSGENCDEASMQCISACSLPNESTWLVIGTNGQQPCSEVRTVNLADTVTMVFFHQGFTSADIDDLNKIEVEFKVEGNKDRKTKWRIEPSDDFFQATDSNGQSRPHAFYDETTLRFRLVIDIALIGGIGGTENPDNNPVTSGEFIEWKWKLDYGTRVQLDSDDNGSDGPIYVV